MPRRGENITKRKDGRWEARVIIGHHENGKARYCYLYGRTYAEAKAKQKEQIIAAKRLLLSDKESQNPCLEIILKNFLAFEKSRVKESTYVRYERIVQSFLLPYWGRKRMNDITQSKVERFAEWLLRAGRVDGTGGLAVKSVRDILSVFRLSLQFADEHGTSVAHIPHVKIAENEKKKIEILTREEEQRLLKYIAAVTDSQKLGVILSLCTGLRIGELCALTWEDIDLNAEVIYVRHTLLRISDPEQMDSKTKILIGSPKTRSSERQIPIPKFLLPMLWEQRCVIQESRSYVLTGTLHYIEPSNYYAKYQRWLKKCNVRPHSFHALRHTFATNCIENGFDVKSLSEILGHADVRITLNRYVHPSMELKRKNMERLSELYSSQKISQ